MRRILLHEAHVHAVPGREVRDLGDAILLFDPVAADPFWNRAEALRWPAEPASFDRRLDDLLVQFAAFGRRPHVWGSPAFDEPHDLVPRLEAAGFRDTGPGLVMVLVDADARRAAPRATGADVVVERIPVLSGTAAASVAAEIVDVLLPAFEVGDDRRPGVTVETIASLADRRFMQYLVRWDGRPAAVARRATFDGITYLSSIGTAPFARGRGFGAMVVAAAVEDAVAAGSQWTYLGVFVENDAAIRLYRRLGFEIVGEPGADLVLLG
jgi:ribosomal protein S18 acetylase RimI-like enzyme